MGTEVTSGVSSYADAYIKQSIATRNAACVSVHAKHRC